MASPEIEALTAREHAVLVHKANGRTHAQIAKIEGIHKRTVDYAIRRINAKFGADCLAHAIAIGFCIGELGEDDVEVTGPKEVAA